MRAYHLSTLQNPPSHVYDIEIRVCRICSSNLSRYNPDDICACHTATRPFDLEQFVDHCVWPAYLPDPRYDPHTYSADELEILTVLSRHVNQWIHLNFVLFEGSRQVVNNTVRKLRRKGFTIQGRRSGGYLLVDRIPPLE